MQRWWTALVVGAVAAGCGSRSASVEVEVVDSAGVQVVTNQAPAWTDNQRWTIDPNPMVSIGQVEGSSDYLLGRIRSVAWLPNGRIIAADESAHAVRVYNPDGTHYRSIGREGEGPGELGWIWTTKAYRGDSLFVYDYSRIEVSVFGPDLRYVRRFRSPILSGNYWVRDALADGRFLLYSPGSSRFEGAPGLRPDSTFIIAVAPDGQAADTIGRFQITTVLVGSDGRTETLYLRPYASIHANNSRIAWTEGATMQYVDAAADGAVTRVVRITADPVPVTDTEISEFKASYMALLDREGRPELRDRIVSSLELAEYFPTLPATSNIKIDSEGNVWLGHYAYTGSPPTHWEVFAPDGRWQGTVETPPGLEVHEIRHDAILGLFTDELGVNYVRVHRVAKPSDRP